MDTHRAALVILSLALACFGAPVRGDAQAANEIAFVTVYCPGPVCDEGGPLVTGLAFPGGTTGDPSDRAPTWSPDGMRIAFVRQGEVMVIDVNAGDPVNVTHHPAVEDTPAWSPDGSRIAFASNREGPVELYLMNLDGSGVIRLTNQVGFAGGPTWSPDGARIAFDCMVESDNADICSINADGSGFRRLTAHPARDFGPAWSPDGTTIAFATTRYSADPTDFYSVDTKLAVMNPDGSDVGPLGIEGFHPSWSSDGDQLAFVRLEPCALMLCAYVHGAGDAVRGFDPAWRPATTRSPFMHIGDLDGTATSHPKNIWTANATITINDSNHRGVPDATVLGTWTGADTVSCTTNTAGRCTVSDSGLFKKTGSATFTVVDVTHATLLYRPADNRDPDRDSDGTRVQIGKP